MKSKKKRWCFLGVGLMCVLLAMILIRKNIYQQSYDKYCTFLLEEEFAKNQNLQMASVRCYLLRINRDWVPELLLCDGSYKASSVKVYTIGKDGNVEWKANLTSNGKVDVFRNALTGIVKAQYGGQGFFYHIYSELRNDNVFASIGANVTDGTGMRSDGVLYYTQFPVPSDLEQNLIDFDFVNLDKKYLVRTPEA